VAIKQFEDIVAWQAARSLVADIYKTTRDQTFARDFGLSSQIQRAAVSGMSNIAEGFESGSPKENARLLAIARASNAEVRSLLYVALDIGYIGQPEFERLMASAQRSARLVSAFRQSVVKYAQSIREDEPTYDAVGEEPDPFE